MEKKVKPISPNVSGLAKVAIFTTNIDAEDRCLINHKCVCGALNRHFCQTRVRCWLYFRKVSIVSVGLPSSRQVSSAINSSLKSLKYSPIIPMILNFGTKIPICYKTFRQETVSRPRTFACSQYVRL